MSKQQRRDVWHLAVMGLSLAFFGLSTYAGYQGAFHDHDCGWCE